MPSKIATWGEVLRRRTQNKSENAKADIADKGEEKPVSNTDDDSVYTSSASDFTYNSYRQNDIWDSSAFTPSAFQGAGVGQSLVCQVSPSQSAVEMY